MATHAILTAEQIESICRTIADTNDGLTGTEIGKILNDARIQDVSPGITKWKRLYDAFVVWQNKHQKSNNILDFLMRALNPVRYIGKEELFEARRHEINKRLAFIGAAISERGTLVRSEHAKTITEAQHRANRFKHKLQLQKAHPEIFKYCETEILDENYFHAVFESIKSISRRLRQMSNVHADGIALAEVAFSLKNPCIRINPLQTDTDKSEHNGFLNIIKGLFGLIRNPIAHEAKIKFPISEEDALDILSVVSLIHKKLDKAI